MISSPAHDRILRSRPRPELVSRRVALDNTGDWVVQDPVTQKNFYLSEVEHDVLQWMAQPLSLHQLRRRLEEKHAPRRITEEALLAHLGQLHTSGLLLSDAPGQGDVLYERQRLQRRRARMLLWTRLLLIRFPGIDPTRFLAWLYPHCRWLLGGWGLAIGLPLIAYALTIVVGQFSEVRNRLPELAALASPANIVLLLVTLAGVKVAHELGHALVAKHVGSRCREMGFQLLAFTPCLYCDVSDSWKLSNKWSRIAVSAAGMVVELWLAAAAIIVWWHTRAGLINSLALNTAIVCSLGTVLFNGNPLLRYDGYFILSDLVGVPNLWERSREALRGLASRVLLGLASPLRHDQPLQRRIGLACYALASNVYVVIMLVSIFVTVLGVLAPHGLGFVAYGVGISMVGTVAIGPLARGSHLARNPIRQAQIRPLRAGAGLTAAAAALAALAFWPFPYHVAAPAVLATEESQTVYATTAGRLVQVATAGTALATGDTVAVLENNTMLLERERLDGERAALAQRLEDLTALQAFDQSAADRIPTQKAMLADVEEQLREVDRDLSRLVVLAPSEGIVIPPPRREDRRRPQRLSSWSGTPLQLANVGAWLQPGDVVCRLGDPTRLAADVSIRGDDIELVAIGQTVKVALAQHPGKIFAGTVAELAHRGRPREEWVRPTHDDADPSAAAVESDFFARVQFTDPPDTLTPGTTGYVKIRTAPMSAAARAVRFIKQTLRW